MKAAISRNRGKSRAYYESSQVSKDLVGVISKGPMGSKVSVFYGEDKKSSKPTDILRMSFFKTQRPDTGKTQ